VTVAKRSFRLVGGPEETNRIAVRGEPILLVGPPDELAGRLPLRNDSEEPVLVRGLEVVTPEKTALRSVGPLAVRARLLPGEEATADVSLSIAANTPPGSYQAKVRIGSAERDLKLLVQARIAVRLSPSSLHFVGLEPGRRHEGEVLLVNEGNVPVQIPPVLYSTALDADTICRNLTLAVREKGEQGVEPTLDAFFQGLRRDLADWVEIRVAEGDAVVAGGDSLMLHLTLRVPKDVKEGYHYRGSVRLFGQQLFYAVMPEPKPPRSRAKQASETGRTKRR
jgi:hypothetical protein